MQGIELRKHGGCGWLWWGWVACVLAGLLVELEGGEASVRHLAGEVKAAMRTVRRGDGDEVRLGVLDLAVVAGEALERESFSDSVRGLVRLLEDRDRESFGVARRALEGLVVRRDLPEWAGEVLGVVLRGGVRKRDMGLRTESVRLLLIRDRGDVEAGEAWLDLVDDPRASVRLGALQVLLDLLRDGGYEAGEAVRGRLLQRLGGEDTGWGLDAGLALWAIAQSARDGGGVVEAESALARGVVNARGEELGVVLRRMELVLGEAPRIPPGRLLVEVLERVVEEQAPEYGVLAAVDLALLAPEGGGADLARGLERVFPAYMGHPSLDIRMAAFGALGRYGAGRLLGVGDEGDFPVAMRKELSNVFDLPVSEARVRAVAAMLGDEGFVEEHGEEVVGAVAVALASADRSVVCAALSSELAGLYAWPEAERLRGWVFRDLGRLGEDGVAFCWGVGREAFEVEGARDALEILLGSEDAWVRQVGGAGLLEKFRGGGDGMGAWLGWFGRLALDEHPAVAWYGVAGLWLGGQRGVAGYRGRLEGLVEAAGPSVRLRLLGILGGSEVPAWGGGVLPVEEGDWFRGLRVRMMRESDGVVREVLGRRR